jgi:hypothetical protein
MNSVWQKSQDFPKTHVYDLRLRYQEHIKYCKQDIQVILRPMSLKIMNKNPAMTSCFPALQNSSKPRGKGRLEPAHNPTLHLVGWETRTRGWRTSCGHSWRREPRGRTRSTPGSWIAFGILWGCTLIMRLATQDTLEMISVHCIVVILVIFITIYSCSWGQCIMMMMMKVLLMMICKKRIPNWSNYANFV